MTKCGYVRVSTRDQHPEAQAQRLVAAGCDPANIYTDEGVSGKLASRPRWDECLAYLRPGDMLVTVKLDRIGRSIKNLIEVVTFLQERGGDLVVFDQNIDTTTPTGKLIFHVLGLQFLVSIHALRQLAAFAEQDHVRFSARRVGKHVSALGYARCRSVLRPIQRWNVLASQIGRAHV